jgi:hypothetical protein
VCADETRTTAHDKPAASALRAPRTSAHGLARSTAQLAGVQGATLPDRLSVARAGNALAALASPHRSGL